MSAGCTARAVCAPPAGLAARPLAAPIAAWRVRSAHPRSGRRQWELQQQGPTTAGRRRRQAQGSSAAAAQASSSSSSAAGDETVDVVVIGSGIGGLSCAGWLAKYGLKVRRHKGADCVASTWIAATGAGYAPVQTCSRFKSLLMAVCSAPTVLPFVAFQVVVCESHDTPGGAAHAWTVPAPGGGLYHLESGPSLYSGQACVRRKDCMLLTVLAAGVV